MIEFGSKLQSVLTAITMAMETLSERIGESILQSMGELDVPLSSNLLAAVDDNMRFFGGVVHYVLA